MDIGPKGLDGISIASPCNVSWESMTGDERVRFCGQCRKNVYNLSSMTRAQGEALVRKAEGKVCVRFYQRADGTMLTDDCPVGVRMVRLLRKKVRLAAASIVGLLGLGSLAGCPDAGVTTTEARITDAPAPVAPVAPAPAPAPPDAVGPAKMGEPCVDPAPVGSRTR